MPPVTRFKRRRSEASDEAPQEAESSKAPAARYKLRSAKSGKAPETCSKLHSDESGRAPTARSKLRSAKSDKGKGNARSRLYSAKSASSWEADDLNAYNIIVQLQDTATFFGVDPLPDPSFSNEFLTTQTLDDMTGRLNRTILFQMNRAMELQEAAVDVFAMELLKALGYNSSVNSHCSLFGLCSAYFVEFGFYRLYLAFTVYS